MSKIRNIDSILDSVSITHKFKKDKLVFLNTSDVLEGKILIDTYTNVKTLKGQAKKTIKNEDILFSEIRPKNKRYAFVKVDKPEDYVVSTKLMVLRNKTNDVLTKYVYYFLTYDGTLEYLQMRAENRIGSFPQITFDLLKILELNVPDLSIQQKIVEVISLIDSKIEINDLINAELEEMAKTLYDYWFIQFDFPNDKGHPYKNSGGKMIWNKVLKREIPEEWGVKKLGDWISEDKSGDWGSEELKGNYTQKVFCIRGADINSLNGTENCNPPIRYILGKNSNKILDTHDLIIEISGGSPTQSTGRMAFITDATLKRFESPLICSNFCKAISLKDKKLLYNFAYYWNSLYDNGIFFNHEGKTSGIKNLLFDSFVNSYWTVVPADSIVKKFYAIMQNIQAKKQTVLAENQQLSNLRDWLLPMLMNGQVKVK